MFWPAKNKIVTSKLKTMKKATIVFLLHLAFALAAHLVASCPDVPSMGVDAACRAAAGTEAMYELCRDAMRDVTYGDNEVSLYALVAAKRALASYDDTARAVDGLLRGGGGGGGGNASPTSSLTAAERDAYTLCAAMYREAGGTMRGVAGELVGCRFAGLGRRYMDGIARLESCRDRLMSLPPSSPSPLYAMNLVDRNKTVLAYFVGRLIGGVDT